MQLSRTCTYHTVGHGTVRLGRTCTYHTVGNGTAGADLENDKGGSSATCVVATPTLSALPIN